MAVSSQMLPVAGQQPWDFASAADGDAFAAGVARRLDQALAERRLWNIHGLIVLRDGKRVIERYFEGPDRARGVGDIGTVTFTAETPHDLRSCSKSIVALLYGIAHAQGKVPAPEAPLLAAFPEYADLASPERARLTVAHALTMTMGTDWDESSLPYSDPRNSEIAMDEAADRYRYILARPVVETPGAHWTYCGGATAVLARLIAKGSGQSLHDFARAHLFDPLGLGPTQWAAGADGEPFAASGARMTLRDFARIGALMLSGGRWDGRELIRPIGSAAARRRPSAPTSFAATAINGFSSMSPSASPRDGPPAGWNGCGWRKAKAASACTSFPPCSWSSP